LQNEPAAGTCKQAERNRMEQIPSSLRTQDTGQVDLNLRRASQFDPAIDKKRKVIGNLKRNASVLFQTVPNVRLNSRFNEAID
jgi:hypothetical protein